LKEQLSYLESTVVPGWERKYTAMKEKERQTAHEGRQTSSELREQLSCSLKVLSQNQAGIKGLKIELKQSLAQDEELLMSLDSQS
jgi:hypothetical protein